MRAFSIVSRVLNDFAVSVPTLTHTQALMKGMSVTIKAYISRLRNEEDDSTGKRMHACAPDIRQIGYSYRLTPGANPLILAFSGSNLILDFLGLILDLRNSFRARTLIQRRREGGGTGDRRSRSATSAGPSTSSSGGRGGRGSGGR
jgi:hypothetical protein